METPVPSHPDGPWARLGEMLARRRTEIEPRYKNRTLFAEATGLNWRLLHDVERAKRVEFKPETIAALESAYQLAPGAIGRALKGGGLEPAAGPGASGPPPSPVPPVAMAEELERAAAPYIGRFGPDRLKAVADGWDPPGDQIFKPGSWEAETWDRLRRGFRDPYHRLWVIAATLGDEDGESRARPGAAAGLTAEAALGTAGGGA